MIFIALIFLFSNCKKEETPIIDPPQDFTKECNEFAALGDFLLLDSSKNFIPYQENIQRVIFSDSLGNEFIGNVTFYETSLNQTWNGIETACPLDTSIQVTYNWKTETKRIDLEFPDLDIRLFVAVRTNISSNDYSQKLFGDFCNVVLLHPVSANSSNSQLLIVLDARTHPLYEGIITSTLPSLTLHGKEFNDVFFEEVPGTQNDFQLYYNSEVGVVGFENEDKSISLKFERVE